MGCWLYGCYRKIGGGKPYLLRGPYSDKKFLEEGHEACNVYGDPALLLPLVYTPKAKRTAPIGIIPHLHDYAAVKIECPNERVISLNGEIEDVIDEICACEYIVSTSLHGVIVAHAYGVPALWVKKGYIYTDGIKFKDYFASVDIPLYDGADHNLSEFVGKRFDELPSEIKSLMLPCKKMIDVQRDILHAAPFEIKKTILDKVK